MTSILDFFEIYGSWIAVGAVIIVLAIIGRYADKTNFGQKEKNKSSKDNVMDNQKDINTEEKEDFLDEYKINKNTSDVDEKNLEFNEVNSINNDNLLDLDNTPNEIEQIVDTIEEKKSDEAIQDVNINKETKNTFDEQYNALNEEINFLLPKKDIIDEDLLDDINNLSLDKTQKINISDIPDLDDVDLPEIKNLNEQDDNIWKF